MNVKTNSNGYRSIIYTDPSEEGQAQLYGQVYEECGVDPGKLSFLEAHGTGTKVKISCSNSNLDVNLNEFLKKLRGNVKNLRKIGAEMRER